MVYPQKMHFFSGKYSIDIDSNWKIRVYLSALRYVVIVGRFWDGYKVGHQFR